MLKEVCAALLEADVNVQLVKRLRENVRYTHCAIFSIGLLQFEILQHILDGSHAGYYNIYQIKVSKSFFCSVPKTELCLWDKNDL